MTYSVLLSEHPAPREAVGHAAGHLFETLDGRAPDVVVVFATPHHEDSFVAMCRTLQQLLEPTTLIGAIASGVMGGARGIESGPALVAWAGSDIGLVEPLHITADADTQQTQHAQLVLADRLSAAPEALLSTLRGSGAVGGYIWTGTSHRATFVIDGERVEGGAVGLSFPAATTHAPVLSQGAVPLGPPLVVTAAEGPRLTELAGRPALTRLRELQAAASPELRRTAERGMLLGIVAREHAGDVDANDVVLQRIVGADVARGALAVDRPVTVGSTVQFQVRDDGTASDQFHDALLGELGAAALLFSDVERGPRFFGTPDHDADAVTAALGTTQVAGVFCHGVFGPVGPRHHLLDRAAIVVPFS